MASIGKIARRTFLIGSAAIVGGVAFGAMGGISWLDSMGFRGAERQVESRIHGYWEARKAGDIRVRPDPSVQSPLLQCDIQVRG